MVQQRFRYFTSDLFRSMFTLDAKSMYELGCMDKAAQNFIRSNSREMTEILG